MAFMRFNWFGVLGCVVLATVAALPFTPWATKGAARFHFEVTITSTVTSRMQLFYDVGRGINAGDAVLAAFTGGQTARRIAMALPEGSFSEFRLDPSEAAGTVTLSDMAITGIGGIVVRRIPPDAIKAAHDIASLNVRDGAVTIEALAGDPITVIKFAPALDLRVAGAALWWRAGRIWGGVFAGAVGLLVLAARAGGKGWGRIGAVLVTRPRCAITAAALLAAVASCYPVVFFGKSFLSPNHGVYLLYDSFPTLPGYDDTSSEDTRGTDIGAVMWEHWPQSTLLHRAVFEDHEWPLWNRYISAGAPLLGQGITTFGNPMQLPALLTGGAVWAWDLHYAAARWLFACGLGLAVWALTKSRGAALGVAVSAPFIGFFAFRFNHPGGFSLCYAPWLLVGWLGLSRAGRWGGCAGWLAVLVVTNLALLTSGALKEGVVQIGAVNALGAMLLVGSGEGSWRVRWKKLAAAAGAGAGFVLLTAPLWLTFFTTLAKSWTIYDTPHASQIDPRALAGLFDDLFYRQPWRDGLKWNPALNFCLLTGVLWAVADCNRLPSGRRFLAVAVAAAGCLALAFRVVPEAWIVRLPFVGKIVHVDNTFSSVALGLLAVLAGGGWARMGAEQEARRWWRCYAATVALLLAVLGMYFAAARGAHSPFFKVYGPLLVAAALVWPLLVRRWVTRPALRAGTVVWMVTVWLLLHVRHGQQLNGFIDAEVVNPQVRVDLKAPSRAVEFLRTESAEPSRVIGFGHRLYQGYNQARLLETPFGVDPLHTVDFTDLAREFAIGRVVGVDAPTPEATFPRDKRFYDLLNVRHYFGDAVAGPPSGTALRMKGGFDLGVFESREAWPRAFFSTAVVRTAGLAGFAARVRNGDGRPFVALEERDWAELGAAGPALARGAEGAHEVVPASRYTLTTNTTAFDIVATGPGVVALQEAYVPGDFGVTLNGRPAAVLRVNHAFKGVYVPEAGRYRVVFSYWPEFFSLALGLGAVGAAGLLAGGVVAVRRRAVELG